VVRSNTSKRVKSVLSLARCLSLKIHIDLLLQVVLKLLKKIFEEETDQLACQLESLVAVVVLVVKFGRVMGRLDYATDHETHIPTLGKKWHVL